MSRAADQGEGFARPRPARHTQRANLRARRASRGSYPPAKAAAWSSGTAIVARSTSSSRICKAVPRALAMWASFPMVRFSRPASTFATYD